MDEMKSIVTNTLLSNIPIISLDSFIEKVFYEKCIDDSTVIGLLFEWANSKNFYCHYTNLTIIGYGNYSKHDSSHSISILDAIAAVIGENRIMNLSVIDLWLLLHCAYAHDIGMVYTVEEAKNIWKNLTEKSDFRTFFQECLQSNDLDLKIAAEYIVRIANEVSAETKKIFPKYELREDLATEWMVSFEHYYKYLTSEFVRRRHAERTKILLEKQESLDSFISSFTIEKRFYKYIAKCSMLHGKTFTEVLEMEKVEWRKGKYCHPAFVAAMLRLGDLLDIDNNRFDSYLLKHYGVLPKISQIHKKKHEAITHILYNKNIIEVTAESDELEVCRCIADWFQGIEEEATQIIFNWNVIAPKCLGGCELSKPKTKIYFDGNLYEDEKQMEFQVNKDMLIKLVIGRNLYKSGLDFLREYIQNAMDAVKMRFWIDLVEGQLDYAVLDGYKEIVKKIDKKEWLPFYYKKSAFERYTLKVKCQFSEENNCVKIIVEDRGIGIDRECIDAIAHIGSGWRKRTNYREYLTEMPAWLKPTGGFGIGLQSGFMVADEILIQTKGEQELIGREIKLYSPEKDGRIEKRKKDRKYIGSSITVSVPYEWFLDDSNFVNYKQLNISELMKDNEPFDIEKVKAMIFELIKRYVKSVVGNSLVPIIISSDGYKEEDVKGMFFEHAEKYVQKEYTDDNYMIFHFEQKTYIWSKLNCILCKIDSRTEFQNSSIKWYYKGIWVPQEKSEGYQEIIARLIGDISIDILDDDVEKYLTIDRNQFVPTFDFKEKLLEFIRVYYDSIVNFDEFGRILHFSDKDIFKQEKLQLLNTVQISTEDYYRTILAYKYIENKDVREKIKEFVNVYLEEGMPDTISEVEFWQKTSDGNLERRGKNEKLDIVVDTNVEKEDIQSFVNNKQKNENVDSHFDLVENNEIEDYTDKEQGVKTDIEIKDKNVVVGKELFFICKTIWDNGKFDIVRKSTLNDEVEILKGVIKKLNIKQFFVSDKMYDILQIFQRKKMYNNELESFEDKQTANMKNESVVLRYDGKNKENAIIEDLFNDFFDKGGKRKILFLKNSFEELYVSKLPISFEDVGKYMDNNEIYMVISPVPPLYMDTSYLKKMIEYKSNQEMEFVNLIMQDKNFKLLLDWVYKHQLHAKRFTKEQIKMKYKELLKKIYKDNEQTIF